MNQSLKPSLCLTILFAIIICPAFAQIKMPAVFSDGMVLQSGKPVNIWGFAAANEKVTVAFGKQKKKTAADDKGNWKVVLNKLETAAVGTDLVITASNTWTGSFRVLWK